MALQCNNTFVLGEFDLRNAHIDCSRGLIWQELENDPYFNFLIQIFICIYGDMCASQWHYGSGPDQPHTSRHMSGDGLHQGERDANLVFSVRTARLHRVFIKILNG